MKKLILLLIFIVFAGIAFGQTATAKIGDYTEYPGPVVIPVEITNFINIGAISINFQYDPAVLTFTGFQNVAFTGMLANSFMENGIQQVGITWSDDPNPPGVTVADGSLIELLFTYTSGTSNLSFIENRCEVVNGDLDPITVLYMNGSISPKGYARVTIPDVSADPNSTVNVPLNFDFSAILDGVSSFTFVIDFDPEVLSYQSFGNLNNVFTGVVADVVSPSRISFTWTNSGSVGIRIAGKLLDMSFGYGNGNTPFYFVEDLSTTGDNSGLDVNAIYTAGTLSQNALTIAKVEAGTQTLSTLNTPVDVPITVDFSGISSGVSSFDFVIDFDANVLQYQSIISAAQPLPHPQVADIVVDVISSSRISVSWLNPGATGSLLKGKLLDVRFNFSGGNSDIAFVTASCDMGDNNNLDVTAAFTDGWVHQDANTIVHVIAGTLIRSAGTVADVPFTVTNFNNIGSFDLLVDFDPLSLAFVSIVNLNAGIDPGNFLYNLTGSGQLGINWANSSPVNLADNTKLFDVRFNFTGGTSGINFAPAGCEIGDNNANTRYAEYTNGSVSENLPLEIAVKVGDVLAQPGTVEVPVIANGFLNLGAFDFAISYDVTKLTFTGVDNAIPALDAVGELLTNQVGNQVFLAWNIDPEASIGLNVDDGGSLFTLNFTYLGGESDLDFDQNSSTVYDFSLEQLDASLLSGSVKGGIDVELTVFLEGLYNSGTGLMNKAQDNTGTGPLGKFPGNIADTITVELHLATNYAAATVYTIYGVELLTDGTASFSIPSGYYDEYYITIKHRNHIETVSTVKSFASTSIGYNFTTSAAQAYGSNQKMLAAGVYGIYAGDVDQNGVVNNTDRSIVDPSIYGFADGYIVTDVDGNGIVNVSDRAKVDPNIYNLVEKKTP